MWGPSYLKAALVLVLACMAGVTQAADYPTLRAACRALGLSGAANLFPATILDSTGLQGVLFIPTNAAISTFSATPGATKLLADPKYKLALARYHIIATTRPAFKLVNSGKRSVNDTTILRGVPDFPRYCGGASTKLNLIPSEKGLYVGGVVPGPVVNVTRFNTIRGKATIYTVDNVLVPPCFNPALGLRAPLSLLEELRLRNNTKLLASLIDSEPTAQKLLAGRDSAVTLFAPTDDAIRAFATARKLNITALRGSPTLKRILLYHVIPSFPFSQLSFPRATVRRQTAAGATDYLFVTRGTDAAGKTTLSVKGAGNTAAARVTLPNLEYGKSVMHFINQVLIPAAGRATTTAAAGR